MALTATNRTAPLLFPLKPPAIELSSSFCFIRPTTTSSVAPRLSSPSLIEDLSVRKVDFIPRINAHVNFVDDKELDKTHEGLVILPFPRNRVPFFRSGNDNVGSLHVAHLVVSRVARKLPASNAQRPKASGPVASPFTAECLEPTTTESVTALNRNFETRHLPWLAPYRSS